MFNVNEVRETLKQNAAESVQQFSQYRGHFDDYVLVKTKKAIKSKLGPAFVDGEFAIARPTIYERQQIMMNGRVKTFYTIVAWSKTARCDIHTPVNNLQILEDVKMTRELLF